MWNLSTSFNIIFIIKKIDGNEKILIFYSARSGLKFMLGFNLSNFLGVCLKISESLYYGRVCKKETYI